MQWSGNATYCAGSVSPACPQQAHRPIPQAPHSALALCAKADTCCSACQIRGQLLGMQPCRLWQRCPLSRLLRSLQLAPLAHFSFLPPTEPPTCPAGEEEVCVWVIHETLIIAQQGPVAGWRTAEKLQQQELGSAACRREGSVDRRPCRPTWGRGWARPPIWGCARAGPNCSDWRPSAP